MEPGLPSLGEPTGFEVRDGACRTAMGAVEPWCGSVNRDGAL